jgi:hypothetical protein
MAYRRTAITRAAFHAIDAVAIGLHLGLSEKQMEVLYEKRDKSILAAQREQDRKAQKRARKAG